MSTRSTLHRRTVCRAVRFAGNGIHMALPAALALEPGPAGHGVSLERTGTDWPALAASAAFAVADESDRRTVLRGPGGQCFQQLEHIMAALAACGITDVRLTQTGPEPPFLDGGAKEYTAGLLEAGFTDFEAEIEPLVVTRPFHLSDGGAELVATPHDGLRLSCFVEFPCTIVGSMGATLEITAESFLGEAAPARTFAIERDIEALRKAGLAKGGNLDNAVVFNESGYLNAELNFPDEVARHKIVDLLGDLALIGRPLRGHFWAWRAGHKSHVRFAQALLKEFANHDRQPDVCLHAPVRH
ncbi:UDP-3-O-acyl-N-acetylglucosamine deacetylase [Candidatus Poribacteria bacterium]|nr:UDP-3-O-acyl-N-acetylglucosamine deacetylase [Candidatus Poribacteria bacterium]